MEREEGQRWESSTGDMKGRRAKGNIARGKEEMRAFRVCRGIGARTREKTIKFARILVGPPIKI